MNMRGVFLHVMGDALGNIGVIAAGLVIWLTTWQYRFYFDPFISLVITVIIFSSALPLVKSASFILLQGVPSTVPLDEVRKAIEKVPGVINVHELHIWSLSESKFIASVHVLVKTRDEFVEVSRGIRHVLHDWGIHSSTIQPEIVEEEHMFVDECGKVHRHAYNTTLKQLGNGNGNGYPSGDDQPHDHHHSDANGNLIVPSRMAGGMNGNGKNTVNVDRAMFVDDDGNVIVNMEGGGSKVGDLAEVYQPDGSVCTVACVDPSCLSSICCPPSQSQTPPASTPQQLPSSSPTPRATSPQQSHSHSHSHTPDSSSR